MPCPICDKDEQNKVSLYAHKPSVILLCKAHSWEIFLIGERRFMGKYKHLLSSQFQLAAKKSNSSGLALGDTR